MSFSWHSRHDMSGLGTPPVTLTTAPEGPTLARQCSFLDVVGPLHETNKCGRLVFRPYKAVDTTEKRQTKGPIIGMAILQASLQSRTQLIKDKVTPILHV